MNNDKNQCCRVCGLFLGNYSPENDYFPWGKNGKSPSYDICVCCGVEFGHGDCCLEGVQESRKEWLEKGNPWLLPEYKPKNWSLEEQFKNIPKEFR